MLVNDKKQCPSASADQEKWDLDQEIAAGLIALTLEPGQHVHIQGLEDDLVKMWETLHHVYVQQQAGTRFNAYDGFMSALLLQNDIDKAKVFEAFVTEESNHLHWSNQSCNCTRFQLSWQTTMWYILRGLAQSFFAPKIQNYLPYSSLMYCTFLNFETTSSQSSS